MKRFLMLVATSTLLLGLVTALAGCGTEERPAPVDDGVSADATVEMRGQMFQPSTVTVSAGETVSWVNEDPVVHNVVGDGFNSASMGSGDSFSHTFEEPGTYDYSCTIHPGMNGTVVVD